MMKADPVETLARQNCASILARYNAQSTALTLAPSTASLAGRGHYSPATGQFKCKTCGRTFASFQSLGGHASSHTKHGFPVEAAARTTSAVPMRSLKVHECVKCNIRFPTGQALGGHMRRHFDLRAKRKRVESYDGEQKKKIETTPFVVAPWKKVDDGEATEEEVEEKVKTVPFCCTSEEKMALLLLDLNLPPVDEDSRNGLLQLF